jgi:hypothetical protein
LEFDDMDGQTAEPLDSVLEEPESADSETVVLPATLLKSPPVGGLTIVSGEAVGLCEGDACFVPSLVRKQDAG